MPGGSSQSGGRREDEGPRARAGSEPAANRKRTGAEMLTIITTFHILAALAIIALVLLQQGKGADAGAAFGAGGSGTVFGARGAASFLTRATAILALVFFLTSLGLAWLASQQVERRSVVERTEAPVDSERTPATPTDVPNAASDVPAADVPTGTSSDN